jgi:hypothetical protein
MRAIEKLGWYDPHCGWVYPRPDTVREKLGDAVANAYGFVGSARLFSANDTTRDIAARDFGTSLVSEQAEGKRLLLRARPTLALNSGTTA